MKNIKMLLPTLFAIILAFSPILPASVAEASAIVHLSDKHAIISAVDSPSLASAMALNTYSVMEQGQVTPMVAAGPDIELTKWNLGVVEYALTVSSTPSGSVTTPGEGVFTYNAAMMARVVAEPEAGYRFVNWSGDVDTIANVNAATTVIILYDNYTITANFGVNWPLIGGVIAAAAAAAAAAGLVIFFVRRRRAARTKRS